MKADRGPRHDFGLQIQRTLRAKDCASTAVQRCGNEHRTLFPVRVAVPLLDPENLLKAGSVAGKGFVLMAVA